MILKIVVDLLFIGMFPVLFPAFLLPGLGPRMIQGYLTGFLYLQLWGPMYVIVHKISMGTAATKSAAAAYIPDSAPGIKIANLEAIGSVNADIAGVAGVMTMMIPVLAGMLTKGAMAVGSQGEALLSQFRSGAEAAGAAATTGNFSFGNTAFENASWNNRSANRWVTSGEMDQGNFRTTDGNLNRTEYGANGTRTLTSSMSNTAWNARFSEGVSSALVEAAGMRREEAQALRRSVSEAQSRVASEGVERVNSWLQSDSKTRTMGSEERDTWSSTYQVMDQVSQNLQRTHGWSESTAKNAVARAAVEAFAEGSVGTPGQGVIGSGARAGARATVGGEISASRNTTETDQVQAARTALSSAGFTDRVDRTTANFASNTFSQTSTAQSMSSEKISDTFSSTRTILDAADQSESQARSYDQRADFTKTNSATIDQNLNNQFTEYAMQRLVGQRDAYGGVIDEERAAYIMSGRGSAAETAMVRELEQSFWQEEVMKIAAPEQVVQGREIGQTVRQMEPEQVRLLEPGGDGSSLRQGVTLAGLGRPGSGTSEFAPGTTGWQAEREERAERAAEAQASRGARGSGDSGGGDTDVQSRVPGGGVANDAGEPVIRPVFNSALRDSIREDVREGGAAIDAHKPADSSLWNSRNVEDTQQEQGSARLGRRYGT